MTLTSFRWPRARIHLVVWFAAVMVLTLTPKAWPEEKRINSELSELEEQLRACLSLFPSFANAPLSEKSSLSWMERWAATGAKLELYHGLRPGTCAALLPELARRILAMPKTAELTRANAFYVLGDFDQAEVAALKQIKAKGKETHACECWLVAANVSMEKGDSKTALERARKAAALTKPVADLQLWTRMQECVARALQMNGDHAEYLNVLRSVYAQSVKQRGALSGSTLGHQNRLANEYYRQGYFAKAEREYRAMLAALDQRPQKDVLQTQVLRDNLAKTLVAQGRKEEAENLDIRLVKVPKTASHETTGSLTQRLDFGAQLFEETKYEEAAMQFQMVYDAYQQRYGPEHKETLLVQNNLAAAFHAYGKSAEAAELLNAIIAIREKTVPKDEIVLSDNRNNLANALGGQKLYFEAAEQHRKVAEIRTRLLGPKNTKTQDALINLASDLMDLEQFEEAEAIARKVVLGREEVLGPYHEKTLNSRATLGMTLQKAGKMEEAEKIFRAILGISERANGKDSHQTLYFSTLWAEFLFDAGRMVESKKWCLLALEGNRKVLGAHHPRTTQCERLLTQLAITTGEKSTTTLASRSVLAKKLNEEGPLHPKTMRARTALAHQLQGQNRLADAAKEYEVVISTYQKHAYMQSEDAMDARNGQAELMRRMGRLSESEALFRALLDDCTRVLADNHILKAQCLANFALLLKAKGEDEEALKLQKEAIIRFANLHDENHPSVVRLYIHVAGTLRKLGRHDEWRVYTQRGYDISKRTLGENHAHSQVLKSLLANPAVFDGLSSVIDQAQGSTLKPVADPSSPPVIPAVVPGFSNGTNVFEELRNRWEKP